MLWHYYAQIQPSGAMSTNHPACNCNSFEGIARRPDSLALSAHLSVGDMPSTTGDQSLGIDIEFPRRLRRIKDHGRKL